jgi:hypothetical protein
LVVRDIAHFLFRSGGGLLGYFCEHRGGEAVYGNGSVLGILALGGDFDRDAFDKGAQTS